MVNTCYIGVKIVENCFVRNFMKENISADMLLSTSKSKIMLFPSGK